MKIRLIGTLVATILASAPVQAATYIEYGFKAVISGRDVNVNTVEERPFYNQEVTYGFIVPLAPGPNDLLSSMPGSSSYHQISGFPFRSSATSNGEVLSLFSNLVRGGEQVFSLSVGCLGGSAGAFPLSLPAGVTPCAGEVRESAVHPRYLVTGGERARGWVTAFGIRTGDGPAPYTGFGGFQTPFQLTTVVPEPQSWAMMILGFGLVGGLIRKARKVRTSAQPA